MNLLNCRAGIRNNKLPPLSRVERATTQCTEGGVAEVTKIGGKGLEMAVRPKQ